jgi:Fe-S-cluster containining protein
VPEEGPAEEGRDRAAKAPRFARKPYDAAEELSYQMERGSQMLQASLNNVFQRLATMDEILGEVVEALAANDLVEPSQVPAAIRAFGVARSGDQGDAEQVSGPAMDPSKDADDDDTFRWPAVVLGTTDDDETPGPEVDCAARMPVCHAVCCMLKFALTPDEIEAGVVKWDIGHPYLIRGGRDGYCVHNTPEGGCGVYSSRPRVCRNYSCAKDGRIWKDFDGMVLNTEWIDSYLPNLGTAHVTITRKLRKVGEAG